MYQIKLIKVQTIKNNTENYKKVLKSKVIFLICIIMIEFLYNTFQSVIKDITNPLVVPIINFCKSFVYTFDILILSHFVRNISLLEAIIISDGLYNGLKFTQEYVLYRVKTKLILNKNDNQDIKQELLKNYNSLYTLNIIDRYILYCLLYCEIGRAHV